MAEISSNLAKGVSDRLANLGFGDNGSDGDSDIPEEHQRHHVGHWLPSDHRVHAEWLSSIVKHTENNPTKLHPVLQELKALIEGNTRIFMLFSSMFEEIPSKRPYARDPTGQRQIRDYDHMLQLLNHLMTTPPQWSDKKHRLGLVGLPINVVFDWPMGTTSGYACFLDPEVNAMLKKVLNAWGAFLKSPDSAAALGSDPCGWFCETGINDLTYVANAAGATKLKFVEIFNCNPALPHHGFKSWDDFFTRTFREGVRPVACPDNDNVVVNSCESEPYGLAYGIKARDKFWIKGQPYSVLDMLAHDEWAPQFVGGTVYQAFLSALSYHRWHSPVSGKVVKAYVKDGTYYAEPLFETLGNPQSRAIDKRNEAISQSYLTAVATRAIIFIEADSPDIGLMCGVYVGMAEVSTCDITVREGDRLKKGDQLGMFHFGGSTHCLMFRPGVKVTGFPEKGRKQNVPVNSQLAVVSS